MILPADLRARTISIPTVVTNLAVFGWPLIIFAFAEHNPWLLAIAIAVTASGVATLIVLRPRLSARSDQRVRAVLTTLRDADNALFASEVYSIVKRTTPSSYRDVLRTLKALVDRGYVFTNEMIASAEDDPRTSSRREAPYPAIAAVYLLSGSGLALVAPTDR